MSFRERPRGAVTEDDLLTAYRALEARQDQMEWRVGDAGRHAIARAGARVLILELGFEELAEALELEAVIG